MAKVIIVGGMCGIVTSWNSFMLGGSRAMYSMAESYMIPKFFAKLIQRQDTYQCTDSHRISHNACTFCRQKDARMDRVMPATLDAAWHTAWLLFHL